MTHFRVAITADTSCPWCYIGRCQLQRAQQLWLQQNPNSGDSFTVSHVPYQLDPTQPRGPASSRDKQKFYEDKFGAERLPMMFQRVTLVGKQLGINFKFGGRIGNTRDAHRLIHLAKSYGHEVELAVINGIFTQYFEKEQDVTSYDTLRAIATKAEIPAQDFQKAIVESDMGGDEVDKAVLMARTKGISGVPSFDIQNRFRVSGARDARDFLRIFEKIKAEERGETVSDTDSD